MIYTHERTERKLPKKIVDLPMPRLCAGLRDQMHEYLTFRDLNSKVAEDNGWYPTQDANDSLPRIVIPATNSRRYNYWQARAMVDAAKIRYQSPRCPRTDSLIIVYPTLHTNPHDPVIVVEGPMDALAAAEFGFRAVALMGNQPSYDVIAYLLSHLSAKEYRLLFDSDAIGNWTEISKSMSIVGARNRMLSTYPYKDLAAIPTAKRKSYLIR